jgi:tRNA pseudouridine38-40 synthase
VHAFGQICHVDLAEPKRVDKIRDGVNFHMRPWPVVLREVTKMPLDWHARFSAQRRHYLYRLLDRRAPTAIDRERVWHVPIALDLEAMQAGAKHLLGTHDFTTFRSSHCQGKSPIKTMEQIDLARVGEEIQMTVCARSFLHHQVRSFMGSLKKVGDGTHPPEWIAQILEAKDRKSCGPVAPAMGLYFMKVDY